MTDRQEAAHAARAKAHQNYRNAIGGERTRARKALESAAVEILKADTEARNAEKFEAKEKRVAA